MVKSSTSSPVGMKVRRTLLHAELKDARIQRAHIVGRKAVILRQQQFGGDDVFPDAAHVLPGKAGASMLTVSASSCSTCSIMTTASMPSGRVGRCSPGGSPGRLRTTGLPSRAAKVAAEATAMPSMAAAWKVGERAARKEKWAGWSRGRRLVGGHGLRLDERGAVERCFRTGHGFGWGHGDKVPLRCGIAAARLRGVSDMTEKCPRGRRVSRRLGLCSPWHGLV